MKQYLDLMQKVLTEGTPKNDRIELRKMQVATIHLSP